MKSFASLAVKYISQYNHFYDVVFPPTLAIICPFSQSKNTIEKEAL